MTQGCIKFLHFRKKLMKIDCKNKSKHNVLAFEDYSGANQSESQ